MSSSTIGKHKNELFISAGAPWRLTMYKAKIPNIKRLKYWKWHRYSNNQSICIKTVNQISSRIGEPAREWKWKMYHGMCVGEGCRGVSSEAWGKRKGERKKHAAGQGQRSCQDALRAGMSRVDSNYSILVRLFRLSACVSLRLGSVWKKATFVPSSSLPGPRIHFDTNCLGVVLSLLSCYRLTIFTSCRDLYRGGLRATRWFFSFY